MNTRRGSVSERQLKVAELIKISIIEAIRKGKVKDLRLSNDTISITKVDISPDLRSATCYFLPMTSINNATSHALTSKELLDALEKSKYGLRAWVTQNVLLKYSPELKFTHDYGLENAAIVDKLLLDVNS